MQEKLYSSELAWDGCLTDKESVEIILAEFRIDKESQTDVVTRALWCSHDKPLHRAPTFILETVLLISSISPTVTMLDFSIWSINTSQSASSVIVLSRSAGTEISKGRGDCTGISDADDASTTFWIPGWAEIRM